MEKTVGFEVVALGKMDDYKAWWEARDKRFQELGLARPKMYRVRSRKLDLVFFEWPAVTSEEIARWMAKHEADEVIQELGREIREKKVLVEGTTALFRMTEA